MNKSQKQAVLSAIDAPLLVVAGAGTGKTMVITKRIEHIIRTSRCAPREILAITFTKNAAEGMRRRVQSMLTKFGNLAERGGNKLSGAGGGRPEVLTIHSFCLRLLREVTEAESQSSVSGLEGLSCNFTICSEREQGAIIEEALSSIDRDQVFLEPFYVRSNFQDTD